MWGRAANVHLSRIFMLQKKILRCIFNVGYREHTAPLFMESKIMTIYQLNDYMVCIFMYMYHHSQLPVTFDNMFITNDNIYTHSTRQQIMYQVPICRLESKRNSLCFVDFRYFNTILSYETMQKSNYQAFANNY